ncbi:MAG: hypothetical protein WC555_14965, partial [Brevundimonas sp.]
MSTESDKPLNGTPEPFRRPVVWGRPPATVFRAGPLPRGDRLPPLPEPPRASQPAPRPGAPDIFSGSMIPRAAPRPAPEPVAPIARAEPVAMAVEAPVKASPAPDLTVRPLPAAEPAPGPRPEPRIAAPPVTPRPVAGSVAEPAPAPAGSTLQAAS